MDRATEKKTVELYRGEAVEITLPPRAMSVIEVKQLEKLDPIRMRTDAAIGVEDVKRQGDTVRVRVHNIGAKDLSNLVAVKDRGRTYGTATLASLAAPNDLVPKMAVVEVRVAGAPAEGLFVVLDPEDRIPEITNRNNVKPVPAGR